MLSAKRKVLLHLKNLPGWTTPRKIVVFSIDDYGNVFLASKAARENLRKAGLDVDATRFSQYDTLENADDLSQLFDTLTSVKDKNGRSAVFTAFAMSANIDFDRVIQSGFEQYQYELLPDTLRKLPGYEGVWALWQEGMRQQIFVPQFHGREHLNVKLFDQLLQKRDPLLLACLENRSYAAIPYQAGSRVGFTEAFSFDQFKEVETHKAIIEDGLNVFEQVFGYRATHFNAPGAREHHSLEQTMLENGIQYIDNDIVKYEHQGAGVIKKQYHPFGQRNAKKQIYLLRNCVFEPTLDTNIDWVDQCMAEIEIAFKRNKPANISSHRVNFVGSIEPWVRTKGLGDLKRLLKAITTRWPAVEFMSSVELGQLIQENS